MQSGTEILTSFTSSLVRFFFVGPETQEKDLTRMNGCTGQYLTEQEKTAPFPIAMRLVDRVYYDIDAARYETRVGDVQTEEFDSESNSSEGDSPEDLNALDPGSSDALANDRQAFLAIQRTELHRLISERFIDGLDKYFDYSIVDSDPALDDLAMENQRLEDIYFDEED